MASQLALPAAELVSRGESLQAHRLIAAVLLLATVCLVSPARGRASVAPGFTDSVVLSGATQPTTVRFGPHGSAYVAEKSGRILYYKSFGAPPRLVADLSTEVYDSGDHGLLGLALDPRFSTRPYLYVLYTYDAPIGGTAPTWGTPGMLQDTCPTPPGANVDGCVTSGRLSRLTLSGNHFKSERVLINDWCNQFTTHSVGDLQFGSDGSLYASGGDGAKVSPDYGQYGSPNNPCGDPPGGVGGSMSPPGAEGGSLRSQDLTTAGDPVGLDGSLIRVSPTTGQGVAGNPLASSSDPNARRILAEGLRNPFRFALQPGTGEIWVGDVGFSTWEEIERLPSHSSQFVDFGWPCYEGASQQPAWASLGLTVCSNLYGAGTATLPYFAYNHASSVVSGDGCPTTHSAIAGLAFPTAYAAPYAHALFFSDFSRGCVWAMLPDSSGTPDPGDVVPVVTGAAGPVDLEVGPGGDLYYVAIADGTVHRLHQG